MTTSERVEQRLNAPNAEVDASRKRLAGDVSRVRHWATVMEVLGVMGVVAGLLALVLGVYAMTQAGSEAWATLTAGASLCVTGSVLLAARSVMQLLASAVERRDPNG